MPLYVYRCPACGHSWEARAKMGETTALCTKCAKAIAHSVIQATALSGSRKTQGKGRN